MHNILEASGRVLCVWAHADDNEWTSAGTIARMSKYVPIDIALLTDSNGQGCGDDRLEEQKDAMKLLGMGKLYAIGNDGGYKDGYLGNEHFGPLVSALLNIINTAAKDGDPICTLVGFGEEGFSGHFDHKLASAVTRETARRVPSIIDLWEVGMGPQEREMWGKNYFVHVPSVNVTNYQRVDISETYEQKIEGIRAHASQLDNGGLDQMRRVAAMEKIEYFRHVTREELLS